MNSVGVSGDDWPSDGIETQGFCPVCGETNFDTVYEDCCDVVFGAAEGVWSIRGCRSCGSGFLDPRPTPDTIGRACSVYYTHESRLKPRTPRRGVKYALLDRIRGSYVNARYGRGQPSLGWLGRRLADRLPKLRDTLDNGHRFLPFPPGNGTPRLLDVGCGNGDFLGIATAAGWATYGSDPDPAALVLAAGKCAETRVGGVEVWTDCVGFFDAITMNHVVEHLHDPAGDLRRCFELLKPGGRLSVETPNFDAYGREIYGVNWRGLEVPRNLVIFTWSSLRATLERCGFEIEREILRDNFVKQALRRAKSEAGIYEYRDEGVAPLRMPSPAQLEMSLSQPRRSEWIGFLARRPE